MDIEFFDPDMPVSISNRNLPHWFQPGASYFVTFRTADSLPAPVMELWAKDRRLWLESHGVDASDPDWKNHLRRLAPQNRVEFHRTFSTALHALLDAGHGACVLRQPMLARIVGDAILHFDSVRYRISDYAVMPNHVHILICLIGETELVKVCYSWKKFTATKINAAIGSRGHFWQGESFDHIVRSAEQFDYFRSYIAANPHKAGLQAGEYLLYQTE